MEIDIGKWIKQAGLPIAVTDDGSLSFLIDTGASYNMLLHDAYEKHLTDFHPTGHTDYLIGVNGDPEKIFLVDGFVTFGGRRFTGQFGVLGITEAMHTVEVLTGKRIDGALGIEFLTRYGATLDFNTLRLHIPDD